ncbi:S-adenosyl-L-methionine-dependent methyltransferase [Infundibulicybe gibba]|nr:S-adenosyl-L-methionine-dependent methyltransferase [Infundibulicybe gibba]
MSADETHNYASSNRTHFNNTAQQYDQTPHATEVMRRCHTALLSAYPFDKDTTRVMEYACGTGLVSDGLIAHSKSILGVDISEGMVGEYNKRFELQGVPPDRARAIVADLTSQDVNEVQGMKFHVIVCTMAYHHFGSVEDVTRVLASFLLPGGVLLVIDNLKNEESHAAAPDSEAPSDSLHAHSVSHHTAEATHGHHHHHAPQSNPALAHVVAHKSGFSSEDMQKVFEAGGLGFFEFSTAINAGTNGQGYQLFLSKGVKPVYV